MIEGIVGFEVKKGEDIQPVLGKLRMYAMTYPGCIGAENVASRKDDSVIAMASTWKDAEDWRQWADSRITRALLAEVSAFLVKEPLLTTHRLMPAARWR